MHGARPDAVYETRALTKVYDTGTVQGPGP
jgi:hypothetical protein